MIVNLDQTLMQATYGLLVVVFIHDELHIDLPHRLMQGQYTDVLLGQHTDRFSQNARYLHVTAYGRHNGHLLLVNLYLRETLGYRLNDSLNGFEIRQLVSYIVIGSATSRKITFARLIDTRLHALLDILPFAFDIIRKNIILPIGINDRFARYKGKVIAP